MKKIIVTIFFLLTIFLFADEIDDLKENVLRNQYQIQNVENKVDNYETINNKLLNSIYVTIGSFSLLVLAFIAVNIIIGIQTKKKELENITKELENIVNQYIEKQDKILSEYKEQIKNELMSTFDSRNKKNENELAYKIGKLEEGINTKYKKYLELANRIEKDRYCFLSNLLAIIEIDLKNRREWEINDSLDSLIDFLKTKEVSIDDADEIKKILTNIPDDFNLRKTEIERQIKLEK